MSRDNNNQAKAIIAAIIATVIWGFSFMVTSIALNHTSVEMLISVRFIASFLIILILTILGAGKIDLKGKPLGLFILMGLCEPVVYFIAETNGIKYTTSSFSGLMISLIPVATALLSVVIIHEHLSLKRFLWIMLSVAGVVIISVDQTGQGAISLKGIIYLIVTIISASLFSILSRKISTQFTSFERTFVMMLMGCIAFTGNAIIHEKSHFISGFTAAVTNEYVMLPVVFLSLFCSVIAFFCMNYSMTYLEVNRAVIFTNITPVISVIAGVTLLGEPFSIILVIGIILILTGVYMVNKVS